MSIADIHKLVNVFFQRLSFILKRVNQYVKELFFYTIYIVVQNYIFTNSTRRFFARPSSVALSAMGFA